MSLDTRLAEILQKYEADIVRDWAAAQIAAVATHGSVRADEVQQQSTDLVRLLREAIRVGDSLDLNRPNFDAVREQLTVVSRARTLQGFSAIETAMGVFSLKPAISARFDQEFAHDAEARVREIISTNKLVDSMGLFTVEVFQKTREEIIMRQGQELLELSTPVVKLWEGVLALPLIGTLDSARTQVVMESLLQMIVETGADVAIIDITGVPTVDTLVAQHLLKTVTAARLMGAECIISGIRPQIAQTIVHLGVELGDIITKASLADAFKIAIQRAGLAVVRVKTAVKE
jgi:rsbT co-antagonist protein RsbR